MKILLTGATGFIGRELGKLWVKKGHKLVVISRSKQKALDRIPFPCFLIEGDLSKGPLLNLTDNELSEVKSVHAVVHLAGEGIADKRWNSPQKKKIYDSRVLGTKHLLETFLRIEVSPLIWISASAVGFYGDQKDTLLSEDSSPGNDFLSHVCQDWESTVFSSFLTEGKKLTTRVVVLRLGLVLHPHGGAFKKMILPFLMNMGAPLGTGEQWMSWIHLDDLLSMFDRALLQDEIAGIFNCVAPQPITNFIFSRELSFHLKTTLKPKLPTFLIKALFGEMAILFLSSQRVNSDKWKKVGFTFKYKTFLSALSMLCEQFLQEELMVRHEIYLPYTRDKILQFIANTTLNKKEFPYVKIMYSHKMEDLGEGTLMIDKAKFKLPLGNKLSHLFNVLVFEKKVLASLTNNASYLRKMIN